MTDINKTIQTAVRTGKTILGAKESVKQLKHGNTKLVILAANTPSTIKNDILHYAKLSGVPTMVYEGSSLDLGFLCGKPFLVSIVSIQNPGDSEILNIVEDNL